MKYTIKEIEGLAICVSDKDGNYDLTLGGIYRVGKSPDGYKYYRVKDDNGHNREMYKNRFLLLTDIIKEK